MWFGDLVTMAWWDDLWLNESFASWMGDKVAAGDLPRDQHRRALGVGGAGGDGYGRPPDDTRHPPAGESVRQPRCRRSDTLAYEKGEAVLGMLEAWLGEEVFRKGVRDYLGAHEWGDGHRGRPLERALQGRGQGRRRADGELPRPAGRTSRAGRDPRWRQGRPAHAAPLRQRGTAAPSTSWQIPVTLKYADGGAVKTRSVLLTERTRDFDLEVAAPTALASPQRGRAGLLPLERGASPPLEHGGGRGPADGSRASAWASSATWPLCSTEDHSRAATTFGLLGSLRGRSRAGDRIRRHRRAEPRQHRAGHAGGAPRLSPPTSSGRWDLRWTASGGCREPASPSRTTGLRAGLVRWLGTWGDDPRVQADARELASRLLRRCLHAWNPPWPAPPSR